jgi:2-polyprenyl-6-methoxyphenol hydroxylase-like FAD-dependent oxidoreductase
MMFERRSFLETLYDNLPDNKAKVRNGQGVVSIDQDDTGVRVTLEDGSVETGDMVVGADGVQSIVRRIMWDHANAKSPKTISELEKKCMRSKNQKFNLGIVCTDYFALQLLPSVSSAYTDSHLWSLALRLAT